MQVYIIPVLTGLLLSGCVQTFRTTANGEIANAIVIETTDGPDTAYRKIGEVLQASGYGLESSDATFRSISTTPKSFESRWDNMGVVRLVVTVLAESPTRVQIVGYRSHPFFGDGPVVAKGKPGSFHEIWWNEVESVAAKYPGGAITYARID